LWVKFTSLAADGPWLTMEACAESPYLFKRAFHSYFLWRDGLAENQYMRRAP
jgi:hypothetical protein